MNNDQFRRLVLNAPSSKDGGASAAPSATPSGSLGSRMRSSIPMTPRSVRGGSVNAEFARQLAERNSKSKSHKSFRSAAPKGSRLAAGYHDRTQDRVDEEADDRAKRIKALEEALKLGQIDRATFDKSVEEIAGGDISGTHLVRGLDRKLLERVRRGEDVLNATTKPDGASQSPPNVEDELEEMAEREIVPIVREKTDKKGEMAPPASVAGVKRSRDAILAELKAARKAAAEAAAAEHAAKYPALGPGFRRIGDLKESSRIEIDERGREVLIITDAEGKEKRKVRKQKPEEKPEETEVQVPEKEDKAVEPIPAPVAEDSDDDDIFEGVGANYNPLAELQDPDDSDSSSSDDEVDDERAQTSKRIRTGSEPDQTEKTTSPTAPTPADTEAKSSTALPRRNYFAEKPSASVIASQSTGNETVLAALKKVRNMDEDSPLLQNEEETRLKKRAAMLATADRDLEDMDLGFGSSRFDDAEEMEDGKRVRLAEWKGLPGDGEDDDEGHKERHGKQRKRGPKKKRADKNNVGDVLKAMERQKKTDTLG